MFTPNDLDYLFEDKVFERAPAVYGEMKLYDPAVHGHPYPGGTFSRYCQVCQNSATVLNLELSTGVWMCSPCIYLPYCKKCGKRTRHAIDWSTLMNFPACPSCQPDKFTRM